MTMLVNNCVKFGILRPLGDTEIAEMDGSVRSIEAFHLRSEKTKIL